MSAFSIKWAESSLKFATLTRRERAIVAVALIVGGGFLIYSLAIEPFLVKAHSALRAETAARAEYAQQQAQFALLSLQNADPDAGNRQRLAKVKQQLLVVSDRLARFEEGMVPPERMQAFLESLLTRNRGIKLLGFKTLPVTQVGAAADTPAKAGVAPVVEEGIYQHGIEIRLAGNYNDLLNYLAELERMPQRLMWNSVNFQVEKYPRNTMILRVYTLSLDRNWLVV